MWASKTASSPRRPRRYLDRFARQDGQKIPPHSRVHDIYGRPRSASYGFLDARDGATLPQTLSGPRLGSRWSTLRRGTTSAKGPRRADREHGYRTSSGSGARRQLGGEPFPPPADLPVPLRMFQLRNGPLRLRQALDEAAAGCRRPATRGSLGAGTPPLASDPARFASIVLVSKPADSKDPRATPIRPMTGTFSHPTASDPAEPAPRSSPWHGLPPTASMSPAGKRARGWPRCCSPLLLRRVRLDRACRSSLAVLQVAGSRHGERFAISWASGPDVLRAVGSPRALRPHQHV